ncbi:MAG: RNA methyltransferase [Nitrospirae bacterium]|nr:RNA methyltransferase [Nitrospirota bacterium]
MKNWKDNIYFVLVEPKEAGNVGASARAIKNMGFSRLSIVNPPVITDEARWFACNALDVLNRAESHESVRSAVKDMSIVVGTTARKGRRRGLILPLDEGVGRFTCELGHSKVAILFGRESRGLFNTEVEECGLMLTIPTSREQPSLNLAQAVMITAYEIAKAGRALNTVGQGRRRGNYERLNLITHEDLTLLYDKMTELLKQLEYIPRGDRDLEKKIMSNLKHFIGRAGITDWELNMLFGIISQIRKRIGE